MPPPPPQEVSDDELFARVAEGRAAGRDFNAPLGQLVERWRPGALYVIRRVRQSYGKGSPEDDPEIFQDAVAKLVERGLEQFRGVSEQLPGKSASPKTFFMRIAKHVAIDRYRRAREVLADGAPDGAEDEERSGDSPAARGAAVEGSRRQEEQAESAELYWAGFRRLQREHPNEAQAWDLYHHQDLDDHQEVAKRLGITVANSYKRVSRAQAYLKAYLLELAGEAGG